LSFSFRFVIGAEAALNQKYEGIVRSGFALDVDYDLNPI
jgi:hypothetical protein